jgi:hypothetical protein
MAILEKLDLTAVHLGNKIPLPFMHPRTLLPSSQDHVLEPHLEPDECGP